MTKPPRICILGGGFAGLHTALRLSQFPWENSSTPEIILIDQSDRFLFTPLLYELITGEMETWEISPPFSELLQHTQVRFYQNIITHIDHHQQQVKLQDNQIIDYDYLVLALGGETPLNLVPGAAEYALTFRNINDAYKLQEQLKILTNSDLDQIRIAVVGAGYSGVELACKLADKLGERGKIRLIELGEQILRNSSEFNRNSAQKALEQSGIWLDLETTVNSIEEKQISLSYKGEIDNISVDVVLWTIGTDIAPIVKELDLEKNPKGQLKTTSYLQVVNHHNIFALGDLAEGKDSEGKAIPVTAQSALQQADYTAWNIWATITHKPLLKFHYQHLGEMMALGIDNATMTGLGITLDGTIGYLARRLIYLYRLPTLEHQLKVGLNWLAKPFLKTLLN
jgi:demethylphylloquinone reductase